MADLPEKFKVFFDLSEGRIAQKYLVLSLSPLFQIGANNAKHQFT